MNKSLVYKNKFYLFISFVFSFFLFLYLIYFLINGQRGIFTYFKLMNLNTIYSEQFNNLDLHNKLLMDRIKRLQPNTIDLDYLEEKIKKNTGFVKDNEIVVIFD